MIRDIRVASLTKTTKVIVNEDSILSIVHEYETVKNVSRKSRDVYGVTTVCPSIADVPFRNLNIGLNDGSRDSNCSYRNMCACVRCYSLIVFTDPRDPGSTQWFCK